MADDLDHDSPVPLFEQLATLLRAGIDAGRIAVRVPSELTLTQQYGVSRGTAHRAIMILVDAGYAGFPGERAHSSSRQQSALVSRS